jgi:hypothetical protein
VRGPRSISAIVAVFAGCGVLSEPVALGEDADTSQPASVLVYPAKGDSRTVFHIKYQSDGLGEGGDGEYVRLRGPRGTKCAGWSVEQPVGDAPGLSRIYFGPDVWDRVEPGPHRDLVDSGELNGRKGGWCRGLWRGEVVYYSECACIDNPQVHFSFRVASRSPRL